MSKHIELKKKQKNSYTHTIVLLANIFVKETNTEPTEAQTKSPLFDF